MKRLAGPPPALAGIRGETPPELIRTIDGMLEPDQSKRFQTSGEVVRALRGGPGASGSHATAELRLRQVQTSRKRLLAGVGVGALLVLALVAWLLTRGGTAVVVAPIDPDMVVIAGGDYLIGSDTGPSNTHPA